MRNSHFLLEELPAGLPGTHTGGERPCQFKREVTTARFYYKLTTLVDLQKSPAVLAETTGQITALVLQILAAQDLQEGKEKGGQPPPAKVSRAKLLG